MLVTLCLCIISSRVESWSDLVFSECLKMKKKKTFPVKLDLLDFVYLPKVCSFSYHITNFSFAANELHGIMFIFVPDEN